MILKLCDPQLSFNILSKFEINESKELAAANQNILCLNDFFKCLLPVRNSLPLVSHDHHTLDPNKYAATTLIFHLIISFPAGNHRITGPCIDLRRTEPLTRFMALVNITLKLSFSMSMKKATI